MGDLLAWLAGIGCEEALSPMVAAGFDSLAFLSLCDGEELKMLEDSLAKIRPAKRSRVLRAARLLIAGGLAVAAPESGGEGAMLQTLALASSGKLALEGDAAHRTVELYHESVQPWEEHAAMGLWHNGNRCWQALQTSLSPICRFRAVHLVPTSWSCLRVSREEYADYFQACGAQFNKALVEALRAIVRRIDVVEMPVRGWPMDIVRDAKGQYDCYCVWMSCRCVSWSASEDPDVVFPYILVDGVDLHGAESAELPQPSAAWKDRRPCLLCWYASGFSPKDGREAYSQIAVLAKAGGYGDCLIIDYPEADVSDAAFAAYISEIISRIDRDPVRRGCPLVLCGHSAGGMLALAAAAALGQRVQKVFVFATTRPLSQHALFDITIPQVDPGFEEFVNLGYKAIEDGNTTDGNDWITLLELRIYNASPFLARTVEAISRGNIKMLRNEHVQGLLRRFRHHGAWGGYAMFVWETTEGFSAPTMAFYGSNDVTTPEWRINSAPGGFENVVVEGAGHMDILQRTEELMPHILDAIVDLNV